MVESRETDTMRLDNNPLIHATSARKRAEQDHILLANRIRLLRAEEEKTRKKIRETENKTQEILDLRRQTEQRRIAKEAEDARREAEERELRQIQQKERDEQRRKLKDGHKTILDQKVAMSSATRQEREVHERAIEEQRLMEAADVVARAEAVRATVLAASRSRARSEGAKHDMARHVVHERLGREEEVRRTKAADIERMEREEAQLVARLQQTQERHRNAYLRLEDALHHHGGSGPRSGFATPLLQEPSMLSRAHAFELSSGTSSSLRVGVGRTARPPRPVAPPVGAVPYGMPGSASATAAGLPPRLGSRPGSSKSSRPHSGQGSPCEGTPSLLQQSYQPPMLMHKPGAHPSARALSSCSTASGDIGEGTVGKSGQSTPVPSTPHQITYTTVDGKEIDLSAEDDLDLATLLNT